MDRGSSNLIEMLSNARTMLNEAKTAQFFGSDALLIGEYQSEPIDAGRNIPVLWELTLHPTSSAGVLPVEAELLYENLIPAQMIESFFSISKVNTNNEDFVWHITGASSGRYDTVVVLSWVGAAEVKMERIS